MFITLPISIESWRYFYESNEFKELIIVEIFSKIFFGINSVTLQLILAIFFRKRQSFIFMYLWVIMFTSSHFLIITFYY